MEARRRSAVVQAPYWKVVKHVVIKVCQEGGGLVWRATDALCATNAIPPLGKL